MKTFSPSQIRRVISPNVFALKTNWKFLNEKKTSPSTQNSSEDIQQQRNRLIAPRRSYTSRPSLSPLALPSTSRHETETRFVCVRSQVTWISDGETSQRPETHFNELNISGPQFHLSRLDALHLWSFTQPTHLLIATKQFSFSQQLASTSLQPPV